MFVLTWHRLTLTSMREAEAQSEAREKVALEVSGLLGLLKAIAVIIVVKVVATSTSFEAVSVPSLSHFLGFLLELHYCVSCTFVLFV